MVISANHFKDVTNGYERRTDGLWVHSGNVQARGSFFDVGSVRVSKNLPPPGGYTGEGMELLYAGTGAAGQAYIQVFDRVAGQTRPLNINASAVNLPAGSIDTAEIAPYATQAQIGAYAAALSWTTTATNVWVATALAATVTAGGGNCRIEAQVPVYHTFAGALIYYGLFLDGAFLINLGAWSQPVASYIQNVSLTYYYFVPAGVHTLAFAVHPATAGTTAIWNGSNCVMYVTEQKR